MTNQRQTDSVLATPPANRQSPENEASGAEDAAGIVRQGSKHRGMTDRPFDRTSVPGASAGAPVGKRASLRRLIRHIPLIDRTLAAYYCARDPETPLFA